MRATQVVGDTDKVPVVLSNTTEEGVLQYLKPRMEKVISEKYTPHPFASGVTTANAENVLRDYLTMSLAFPYLQAGAHHGLIAKCLAAGEDVSEKIELTAAVGAFLFWDELGGHHKVLNGGNAALPSILATDAFHANLLRDDIRKLLGKSVRPGFSRATREYLTALGNGLGSSDAVERVAHMVAFERHAGTMIDALWMSLQTIFQPTENLAYFEAHVGGDDPAEAYHVAMTSNMIERIVDQSEASRFLEAFDEAYRLSFEWCAAVKIDRYV